MGPLPFMKAIGELLKLLMLQRIYLVGGSMMLYPYESSSNLVDYAEGIENRCKIISKNTT